MPTIAEIIESLYTPLTDVDAGRVWLKAMESKLGDISVSDDDATTLVEDAGAIDSWQVARKYCELGICRAITEHVGIHMSLEEEPEAARECLRLRAFARYILKWTDSTRDADPDNDDTDGGYDLDEFIELAGKLLELLDSSSTSS